MLSRELSVLEKLQCAYSLLADSLAQARQLYDWRLDQALLVLSVVMNQARRSRKLRRPPAGMAQPQHFTYHQ